MDEVVAWFKDAGACDIAEADGFKSSANKRCFYFGDDGYIF